MEPVPINERRNEICLIKEKLIKTSEKLLVLLGGKENIQGVAHCATRLRIVLDNYDRADLKAIGKIDLVKGSIYCRRSIANNIWGRYCKQCL